MSRMTLVYKLDVVYQVGAKSPFIDLLTLREFTRSDDRGPFNKASPPVVSHYTFRAERNPVFDFAEFQAVVRAAGFGQRVMVISRWNNAHVFLEDVFGATNQQEYSVYLKQFAALFNQHPYRYTALDVIESVVEEDGLDPAADWLVHLRSCVQ